jgi:hypothetical protein
MSTDELTGVQALERKHPGLPYLNICDIASLLPCAHHHEIWVMVRLQCSVPVFSRQGRKHRNGALEPAFNVIFFFTTP